VTANGHWFVLDLGDAMLAGPELDRVTAAIDAEWRQRGAPGDLAAYFRHESDGSLHCSVKVYFPPAVAALATGLGAVPCPAPHADGLGVLAGAGTAPPS